MANFILNKVTAQDFNKLYEALINKETNQADFNKIIPLSADLNITAGCSDYEIRNEHFPRENIIKFQEEHLDRFLSKFYNSKIKQTTFTNRAFKNLPASLKENIITTYNLTFNGKEQDESIKNIFKGFYNLKKYNHVNWYEAHNCEWGTKWNADETYITSNTIQFKTAWSTPVGVWKALSKITPITVAFADMDDVGGHFGIVKFVNGKIFSSYESTEKNIAVDMGQALSILEEDIDEYFCNYTDEEIKEYFKMDKEKFLNIVSRAYEETEDILNSNNLN